MKKIIFTVLTLLMLFGCGSQNLLVKSNVIITTEDEKVLWIMDNDHGRYMYQHWVSGVYKDVGAEIHLIDSLSFTQLYKRAK